MDDECRTEEPEMLIPESMTSRITVEVTRNARVEWQVGVDPLLVAVKGGVVEVRLVDGDRPTRTEDGRLRLAPGSNVAFETDDACVCLELERESESWTN